jgi:NADPH-dependent ferric siderophore reductase
VAVHRVEYLSPRLIRVVFAGPDLEDLTVEQPAASVRLLLPSPGTQELVVPSWNGNEFLLPDERRPTIRTFTPRHVGPDTLELDIVVHDGGVASEWAQAAETGNQAAISGPGRGYTIDRDATNFLLAGDETTIPAISQILEALTPQRKVKVRIEVAHPDARIVLPDHPRASTEWYDLPPSATPGDALFAAVLDADLDPGSRVWVAGEAASNGSVVTSFKKVGCPAPKHRCAAIGSTAAPATATTSEGAAAPAPGCRRRSTGTSRSAIPPTRAHRRAPVRA